MKGKTRCLLIVAAVLLLTACDQSKENCEQKDGPEHTWQAKICTDDDRYDFGEPIRITLTVANVSNQPLTLEGGDRPALDIRVQGQNWSDGKELTPDLTRVSLEPGESRTLEWVWPTPATDLEALEGLLVEQSQLSIGVYGLLATGSGPPETVWVYAYYRAP